MFYDLFDQIFFDNLGISFVSVSDSPNPPFNTVCHGKQNSDLDGDGNLNLWSVMANTPHGKIPGIFFILRDHFLNFSY